MENNPSYFVQIPGIVIEDQTLSPYSKLLFGIIQGLCSVQGHCYASSDYLAKRLGVTDRAIRNYVVELLNAGHIRVERTDTNKRKIFIETKVVSGKKPQKQVKIAEQPFHDTEQPFQISGTMVPDQRNNGSNINKKENIQNNKKEREREESHTKLPDKDPFDADPSKEKPIITIDGTPYSEGIAEWVMQKFHDYYRKEFKTSAGDLKKQDACKLYSLLISDDKEQELDQIILMYEYSWHGTKCQQAKRADYPMKPTPTRIIANWDKLSVTNIPYWIRDGHETETAWKTARQQRLDTEKEARHKVEIVAKPYNAMEDPLMIEQLAELEKMKLSFT